MAGRLLVIPFLSAALAFLLLFSSGSNVEATTFKVTYRVTLTCEGPDGVAATADDTCTCEAGGASVANQCPDMRTNFDIPATPWSPSEPDHANFTQINTFYAPPEWGVAPYDPNDIPNDIGAYAGLLFSMATLSIANSPCTASPNVTAPLPLYVCDTNNHWSNQIVWQGDGANLTQDNDGDTLPDGCNKYPRHVNTLTGGVINDGCPAVGPAESGGQCEDVFDNDGDTRVNDGCPQVGTSGESGGDCDEADTPADPALDHDGDGVKPRSRLYSFNTLVPDSDPTQIHFVVFNPGQLAGQPGVTQPEADLGDSLGYSNAVILDNTTVPATPSTITEFCTPLASETTLWGLAGGEGEVIPPAGANPELGLGCINWKGSNHIGVNDDPSDDGVVDDGCWAVTDWCGDGVDNDGDTDTDELCGSGTAGPGGDTRVMNRTPNANVGGTTSGVHGTATHLIGVYSESQRDADGDGFPNNLDACPYIASSTVDNTNGCDGCPPGTCTAADQDGDTFYNRQDICPLVPDDQTDGDTDGIGKACDTDNGTATPPNGDQVGDGPYLNDMPRGGICVGDTDTDGDGWCDATETALGSDPNDDSSTPENATIDYPIRADPADYGNPGAAPGSCSDLTYYGTPGGPNGHGTAVNNNLIGGVNDDEERCSAENDACVNALNDDPADDPLPDWWVNDGCPQKGLVAEAGVQCANALDDDADTIVNDGCPPVNAVDESTLDECANNTDDDGDTNINDGCPQKGDDPEDPACVNALDDDPADDSPGSWVNDGCPQKGAAPEAGADCNNALDDDADTIVNDGCPAQGTGPVAEKDECANDQDDDGDTNINDGCPPKHPDYMLFDVDTDGLDDLSDNCPSDPNPEQLDIDGDGTGDACDDEDDDDGMLDSQEWAWGYDPKDACSPFDLNDDGSINVLDVLLFKPELGGANPKFDLNQDGSINVLDVLLFKPVLAGSRPCPYDYG